jgi:hypothetical protein
MSTITLKTAPPDALLVAARSLGEISSGVFVANARIERPGEWELVATTGVAGTTACVPLRVDGVESAASQPVLVAEFDAAPRAGEAVRVRVTIRDWAAKAIPLEAAAMALDGGWRQSFMLIPTPEGVYEATITFPRPGLYPMIVSGQPGVKPALIEVRS